ALRSVEGGTKSLRTGWAVAILCAGGPFAATFIFLSALSAHAAGAGAPAVARPPRPGVCPSLGWARGFAAIPRPRPTGHLGPFRVGGGDPRGAAADPRVATPLPGGAAGGHHHDPHRVGAGPGCPRGQCPPCLRPL